MEIPRLSLPITNEEVKNFCLHYFHENCEDNLKVIRYEVTGSGEIPKGYLGKHQYLNVIVKHRINGDSGSSSGTDNGNEYIAEEEARFFIKSAPQDVVSQMEYLDEFGVFKKEEFVYKYVIPRFQGINIQSGYFAPKCYLAKTNILVFENLSIQGYYVAARQNAILSYDHLVVALKCISNMHAASLVLELRTHQSIPDMYKIAVQENSYPSNPLNVRCLVFKKAVQTLSDLVKEIPKYQNSLELPRILISLPQVLGRIFEFVKPSTRWKNTFCHGDLWANNILFKDHYSTTKNKSVPYECLMVDFQLARYAPPILDVITILTMSTASSFREEYLTDLLDTYYDFLRQHLAQHDINVEEIIPKYEFDSSAEHFKLAGLIESCLFSHLCILPPKFCSNVLRNSDNYDDFLTKHRSELCLKVFQSDSIYRERMTDILSAIVDNYIIIGSNGNSLITKV